MSKLHELMESRMAAMQSERRRLVEQWAPYVNSVEKFMAKQGKELNEMDKMNIARCLENALLEGGIKARSKIFETTDQSAISFLGIQLPVIAALLPSLVLNKLAVTQALDRRTGAVFYLDVKYNQNKGGISAAQTMMGAKTGHNTTVAGRRYASVRVQDEVLGSAGGLQARSGTLAYKPVIAGSLVITDGVETFTDNGANVLVSDASGGVNGTISYTNGAWAVTFATTPAGTITGTYKYNYETMTGQAVPEVDISVVQETITAEDFPLAAKFTLGAAIDLEKAHGLNLEDELVKYLGGEVKFTMDHLGIDMINTASQGGSVNGTSYAGLNADSPGTYTATPGTNQEWIWKKYQFIDFVEKANVNIINKTFRAICNFLVVGNDAARVIRQLDPHFKAAAGLESLTPTGPYELGTLDGRLIVHDPLLAHDEVVFGYKGDNYLMSGFLFAPYIPLLTTPTLVTADLKAQKGFLASAGYKVVNAGMYTHGTFII
jgi:hypothetical protein